LENDKISRMFTGTESPFYGPEILIGLLHSEIN